MAAECGEKHRPFTAVSMEATHQSMVQKECAASAL